MSTFAISKTTLNRRRVLFVDDEVSALQTLQRVFESMRNEWHMEFLTSAAAALERIKQIQFDAVVTDLKMPGMSGAELLEKIAITQPTVCRVILSGPADEDLIFQSVTSAHQFISKTADAKTLQNKLRKLILLRQSKLPLDMVELICSIDRLPTVPSVYTELVESLSNPETDLATMAEIISRDAGIGAKVLQLANSAFFGLRGEVASILEAVTFLGIETVRYLVLMVGVCDQFRSLRFQAGFLTGVWNHSLQTANICRILAEAENASAALSEQACVAGLLHDLGKLVLAENRASDYRQIMQQSHQNRRAIWQIENEVFKATHANIGAYLLELWGLPEGVTRAVALHHEPTPAEDREPDALCLVHVANYFAHEIAGDAEATGCDLSLEYLEAANLTDRLPMWQEAVNRTLSSAALV